VADTPPVAESKSVTSETIERARDMLKRAWRLLSRRLYPPSLQVLLCVLLVLLGVVLALQYIPNITLWHDANHACHEGEFGCGLVIHVVGTGIVALLAFNFVFLRRETRAAAWWRSRAEKTPEALFQWLPPAGGVTGLAVRVPRSAAKARAGVSKRTDEAPAMPASTALSLVDEVVGRERLVEELATELDEGGTALVLVGPTGSGKTMVLLKLTQELTRRGQVPVPVSLRDRDTVDFEGLARDAFHEAFPQRTEEEADKQWRWLRRRGLITLIVDDLEKSSARPVEVARALEAAAAHHLRIIAACRPNGIPANLKRGRIDLPELRGEDVKQCLIDAAVMTMRDTESEEAQLILHETRERVEKIVEDAAVPSTPYYLAIGQVLAATGQLRHLDPPERGAARRTLLDAYRATVETCTLRPEAALSEATRKRVLDGLEPIAYARLWCAKTVEDVAAAAIELEERPLGRPADSEPLEPRVVIEYAQRLGILEQRFDGLVRFGHPTTLAYFASCFLVNRRSDLELWTRVIERRRVSSTASLAFVLAAAVVDEPKVVAAVTQALLARPELQPANVHGYGRLTATRELFDHVEPAGEDWAQHSWGDDEASCDRRPGFYDRVMLLKTTAEVARSAGGLKDDVAAKTLEVMNAEPDRSTLVAEQIRLVNEIALLECDAAYGVLWNFATTGGEYRVRRAAMRAILNDRPRAVAVAVEKIGAAIAAACEYQRVHPKPAEDDRHEPFQTLRAAAWALPCLRRSATGAEAATLVRYQESLSKLANALSEHRGLEASIAQGLKLDAMWHHADPPDPLALQMLEPGPKRAQFWYSRVLLLHAVTRRSICNHHSLDATARMRELWEDRTEHPFVREAARLCLTALETGKWEPYIPIDITEIAAGMDGDLPLETKQLIGDIVLALNLNDQASAAARIKFGTCDELPQCLEKSDSRGEILGRDPPYTDCPFHDGTACLCPHTYDPPSGGIRRELSRAFCRDLKLHAEPQHWHHKIHRDALREFWAELESRARF
jgi:hypothetical protein